MNEYKQKLEKYGKEKWIWKGKEVKLEDMSLHQLEICNNFVKQNPIGKLFDKNKSYWRDALKFMIKDVSNKQIKVIINSNNRFEVKTNRLISAINTLTVNKEKIFNKI